LSAIGAANENPISPYCYLINVVLRNRAQKNSMRKTLLVTRPWASQTIRRAELMPSATVMTRANDQAIRRALEQAGVDFIDAEDGGPGVRLRVPPAET
jgi:hypothetical protein